MKFEGQHQLTYKILKMQLEMLNLESFSLWAKALPGGLISLDEMEATGWGLG
jgi:hypothetical protein